MTKRIAGRLLLCTAVLASAVPAAARHKAAPASAHNFVELDLTASHPAPLPGNEALDSKDLLDSASTGRDGDAVTFDVLHIAATVSVDGKFSHTNIATSTGRFQASCNWRTLRRIATWSEPSKTPVKPRLFEIGNFEQDIFLDPQSPFHVVVDRLCEGVPLNAADGLSSVAAAVALWHDSFATMALMVSPAPPPPPEPAWMAKDAPHRFTPVTTDDANGNRLFGDGASRDRDGDRVTALSLVLLGPDTQRAQEGYQAVARERKARYDCAARTMTILAQGDWDRYRIYLGQRPAGSETRAAANAPVTAAEIAWACGDDKGATGFASVMQAWDDTRAHWPPSPVPALIACVWDHLAPGHGVYLSVADTAPAFTACNVPDPYKSELTFDAKHYGEQRAALLALAAHGIGEAAILAAWRAQPAEDRQRMVVSAHVLTRDGPRVEAAMAQAVAQALRIPLTDTASLVQLEIYLKAQAWLDGSG